MSSYSELRLGAFYLDSERDDIGPDVMSIFRESDRRIQVIDRTHFELWKKYVDDDYDDDGPITIVQFACSAKIARDRLDLMGFTKEVAKASFNLHKKTATYQRPMYRNLRGRMEGEIQFLHTFTVEDWIQGIEEIGRRELTLQPFNSSNCLEYTPVLRYMLCEGQGWYGFPGYDRRHYIRLMLDLCSDSDELIYDLTDLALGGWFEESEELVAYASEIMDDDFVMTRRQIILTEGHTDKWILERSINLLYPHLSEYFHFFDFKGNRAAGGAGELVNNVKAFAAAGIANRIIALFDNDTAAEAALISISDVTLPENVIVQKYPDTELANDYMTLGPAGMVSMNVNGLAGSIELYLGEDILCNEAGGWVPIQWTGYERRLEKYQGEIINKSDLLEKFDRKLKTCEADSSKISSFDWSGIRAILNTMITAFHELDAKNILDEQSDVLEHARSLVST